MTLLLSVGTFLTREEMQLLFFGLGLMLTGALMIPLISCYERMSDERYRKEALIVHDDCIAPPVCHSIANEQNVGVADWKDYFSRDNTFE